MELAQLKELVTQGESETLEFKKSTGSLKNIMQTLCGFLNSKGGMVIVGVTPDKHELVGQEVKDDTERKIAEMFNKLEPSASIEISKIPITGTDKQVIVLKTNDLTATTTYQFDGRAYQRVGTTTTQMSQYAYQQLIMERVQSCKWDKLPAKGCTLDLLDQEEIYSFIKDSITNGRLTGIATKNDIMQILQNLELAENGQINNAAMVLFAKSPQNNFDHCNIKMARFHGNDKSYGFLDEKRAVGNAFKILEEGEIFVKRHLSLAMKVTSSSFKREEKYAIPLDAIREALVNAICHRDYSMYEASINIAIYNDWMEIWNIGKLPSVVNLEDLRLLNHNSCPRNKLISQIFYKRKLFEGWGTGTTNIISLCKEQNIKEPVFTEYSGGFCVRFYMETNDKGKQFTQRQQEILMVLEKHPNGISSLTLIDELPEKMAERTARRELHRLESMQLIKSVGTTKSRLWFLAK